MRTLHERISSLEFEIDSINSALEALTQLGVKLTEHVAMLHSNQLRGQDRDEDADDVDKSLEMFKAYNKEFDLDD